MMTENPSAMPEALAIATQMVKGGRLDEAQAILVRFLAANPASEQAWLLMSYVVKDLAQQKDCLERVLRINPGNLVARSKQAQVSRVLSGEPSAPAREEAHPEQPSQQPPTSAAPSSSNFFEGQFAIRQPPATPAHPAQKPDPHLSQKPEPKPAPKPEPRPKPGKKPISKPVPQITSDSLAHHSPQRANLLPRVAVISMAVIIIGIILAAIYFGTQSPLLSDSTATTAPTPQVIMFTLPPAWTVTRTPTVTSTATVTPTETPTPTDTPKPSATQTPRAWLSSIKVTSGNPYVVAFGFGYRFH